MAIRAVVFDLGGVLENEVDTGKDAQWEARLNMQPGEGSIVSGFIAPGY